MIFLDKRKRRKDIKEFFYMGKEIKNRRFFI